MKHPILFRLDSGNDAFEAIKVLLERKNSFLLIKRNPRRERREEWLEIALYHDQRTSEKYHSELKSDMG